MVVNSYHSIKLCCMLEQVIPMVLMTVHTFVTFSFVSTACLVRIVAIMIAVTCRWQYSHIPNLKDLILDVDNVVEEYQVKSWSCMKSIGSKRVVPINATVKLAKLVSFTWHQSIMIFKEKALLFLSLSCKVHLQLAKISSGK